MSKDKRKYHSARKILPGGKRPLRAVFHQAEFSARNIFFCLLTPTLRELVLNKRKCRSARKIPPCGKWPQE